MRENGRILAKANHALGHFFAELVHAHLVDQNYGGSFANLIRGLQQEKSPLTALDVVLKVVELFPSFRGITTYGGREGQSYDLSPFFSF